ncbi:MAG: integrase [Mucilaginibacter sp.]|nr:integrase [Mucilaginibacter sp.]
MRTVNTFGRQFLIRPDKLKDGKAPIYVRITVNKAITHLGLKQYIEPKSWDVRRSFGKGTRDEVRALNNYLEDVCTEIGQCHRERQLKKLPITAEAIKNTFLRTEEVEHTLNRLFTYHNKTAAHQLSPNTLSHYETSQKYLRSFIKEQS